MIRGIDHVVIAVRDIDEGIRLWRDGLGLKLSHRVSNTEAGVEVAFFCLDDGTFVELVAATSETTALHEFVADKGEGLRLLSMSVDDLDATVDRMTRQGLKLDGVGTPRVFVRPDDASGILLQLWPQDRPHRWRDGDKAAPANQETN